MHRVQLDPTTTMSAPRRTKMLLFAGAGYLLFIVYGSLVPLDFHPWALDAAWARFVETRYLILGVESRADWVANILLYIPLGYLLSAGFANASASAGGRLLRVAAAFIGCVAVAVAVEFAQLFFPPRTVSLNDIIAEIIGTGLGVASWLAFGKIIEELWMQMGRGGQPAIRALIVIYVLAYAAFSLFPYDFLISGQELADKLAAHSYGLLEAPGNCDRFLLCGAKLITELVAVVPLGILLGMALRSRPGTYAIAALTGLALAVAIEVAQLFLASGISEGLSLVTRAAGVWLGAVINRHMRLPWLAAISRSATLILLLATPAYLLGLMWANGWFSAGWVDIGMARANLANVRWLPFYYHYFTTETAALQSLLRCTAMYLPVGLFYCLWTLRERASFFEIRAATPAVLAAMLSVLMESGKLFVPGKHPDPTNVLIAAVAALTACLVAVQLHHWALQGTPQTASRPTHSLSPVDQAGSIAGGSAGRILCALVLLCATVIALANHPFGGAWLALALAIYAALSWHYPGLALPLVVALLPLLNFAKWSGWNLLNEFDLLMAVTVATRLLQRRSTALQPHLSAGVKWLIGMLTASFAASALIGLFPLSPFDRNALVSYYGSFNSLAELKGYVWALAILPLLIEASGNPRRMDERLIGGMVGGLVAVVAVIVWERAAFAGLFDFAAPYRIDGTFPEAHTGGGDIHAYLVMMTPMIVAWIALVPTPTRAIAGLALFAAAGYALSVTFARGGYVGYAGACAILVLGGLIQWLRRRAPAGRGGLTAILITSFAGAALLMAASGSFMRTRIADTQAEAGTRSRHWLLALDMRNESVETTLFGMGLGSFPRTFLFKERDAASATVSYQREGGNGFVRMGSGKPLYLGQRVSVEPGKRYTFTLDLRGPDKDATVDVPVCEKSAQYSFQCIWLHFAVRTPGPTWEHHEATLDSGQLGSGGWLLRRPVVLSLANPQRDTLVEVDNVRLFIEPGENLIVNGDFSHGGDRWFFAADDHLPWHILNLEVQILFEQGWFGLIAFLLFVSYAVARLAVQTWRGDYLSATFLASLFGYLLIGLTESLFDGPRVTTLFFILLFTSMLRPTSMHRGSTEAPRIR